VCTSTPLVHPKFPAHLPLLRQPKGVLFTSKALKQYIHSFMKNTPLSGMTKIPSISVFESKNSGISSFFPNTKDFDWGQLVPNLSEAMALQAKFMRLFNNKKTYNPFDTHSNNITRITFEKVGALTSPNRPQYLVITYNYDSNSSFAHFYDHRIIRGEVVKMKKREPTWNTVLWQNTSSHPITKSVLISHPVMTTSPPLTHLIFTI
jgi:hypothetical protein